VRKVSHACTARRSLLHGSGGHGRGAKRGDALRRAIISPGHHPEQRLGRRVHVLRDARGIFRLQRVEKRLPPGAVRGARPVANKAAER
jgi:hypothetical protein